MAKQDPRKPKLEVPEAGDGRALKHNPFGALGGSVAPPDTAASTQSSALPNAASSPIVGERTVETKKSRGRLVLRRETKRRGGKAVVIVSGLRAHARLAESEIAALAQDLKQQLGCGGTIERVPSDTEIVLQGDQPARVAEWLRARGFRVDGVTA
jgi:translation initiation factor 1 (eIF-1/SUI1)